MSVSNSTLVVVANKSNSFKNAKFLTEEQELEIIRLYENDIITKEIKEKFNISNDTIRKVLRKHKKEPIYSLNKHQRARLYQYNERIFENMDTPEKAYWLGLLMGDGCISKGRVISLGLIDLELIKNFIKFLGNESINIITIKPRNINQKPMYYVKINSKKMTIDLSRYGLIERKSYRTSISEHIPKDFIKFYILGYSDADGSVCNSKNGVRFTIASCSNLILEQIKQYLETEGINRIKIVRIKFKNDSDKYYSVLCIRAKQEIIKLFNLLYNGAPSIFLQRKYNKFLEVKNRPRIVKYNNFSKYIGVTKSNQKIKPFYARIYAIGIKKPINLGAFSTELEAAIAYNNKAKELNLPDDRMNKI